MNTHQSELDFLMEMEQSLRDGSFVRLSLGNYKGEDVQLTRLLVRRILIKREEKLSFTYQYKTRDIVKNHTYGDGIAMLRHLLSEEFHAGLLYTTKFDVQVQRNPDGRVKLRKNTATHVEAAELSHDKQKKRLVLPEGKPYLHLLNITDADGKVRKNAQDKYRQIDKYVEILSGLIKNIPAGTLKRIVDMGCGKGYLTFALYDYVTHTLGLPTEIVGVDTRADMVELCNSIAVQSGFSRLSFVQDTIENYDSNGVNLLIALHACDTATDEAIAKDIMAGAELIVVAPCCHKQIRRQMDSHPATNEIGFLTKHGIFAERQAEMVTDSMRAQILEYFGYSCKIFEFISDAHTPKNIMIVGTKIKTTSEQNPALLDTIRATKAYFGVEQHFLEKIMKMES